MILKQTIRLKVWQDLFNQHFKLQSGIYVQYDMIFVAIFLMLTMNYVSHCLTTIIPGVPHRIISKYVTLGLIKTATIKKPVRTVVVNDTRIIWHPTTSRLPILNRASTSA